MKQARILKFRLIAPTKFNWKRLSVKCPLHDEWIQYFWDKRTANDMHDQVELLLISKLGFKPEEIICYSEDKNFTYVMLSNHDKHILKEENH